VETMKNDLIHCQLELSVWKENSMCRIRP